MDTKRHKPGSKAHRRAVRTKDRAVLESVILAVMTGEPEPDNLSPHQRRLRELAKTALERARSDSYTASELARALLELELLSTVAFLVAVRDNQLYDEVQDPETGEVREVRLLVDTAERLRAAENIANRGGLPVLSESVVKTNDLPQKLVDIPRHPARVSDDQPPAPEFRPEATH